MAARVNNHPDSSWTCTVADDEKTRWAIDVMTAWADHGDDNDFMRARIREYAASSDGSEGLIVGLVNLSGLLLSGTEMCTGKDPQTTLRAIGSTVARQGRYPSSDRPPR